MIDIFKYLQILNTCLYATNLSWSYICRHNTQMLNIDENCYINIVLMSVMLDILIISFYIRICNIFWGHHWLLENTVSHYNFILYCQAQLSTTQSSTSTWDEFSITFVLSDHPPNRTSSWEDIYRMNINYNWV